MYYNVSYGRTAAHKVYQHMLSLPRTCIADS